MHLTNWILQRDGIAVFLDDRLHPNCKELSQVLAPTIEQAWHQVSIKDGIGMHTGLTKENG